jgi:hypothetical protein
MMMMMMMWADNVAHTEETRIHNLAYRWEDNIRVDL